LPDLCGGLLILAMVVGGVAVVGHLLWLMLAAIFKAMSGIDTDRRALRCPACNHELRLHQAKCVQCGCRVSMPPSITREDPEVEFEKQLTGLLNRGVIDAALFKKLSQAARKKGDAPELAKEGEKPRAASEMRTPPGPVRENVRTGVPLLGAKPQAAMEGGREIVAAVAPAATGTALARIEAPVPVGSPASPASSGPGLSDLFRSFMDENNIRWGELISGLLIVGSGIGLVISLWETLKDAIPYFPALLFMLVTAAIHGAGMYTLHRWNLKSTSRGLLIISVFLIPLNYLAAVALSDRRPANHWMFWAALGTGLAVFGAMTWSAGRKLLLADWGLLPIGVVGASAGQVLISRIAAPHQSAALLNLLFALPLVSFLSGAVGQLAMAGRWPRLTLRRAAQVFLVAGVTLFALLVAVGILVWKCESIAQTLADLSPSLSLVAAVILGTGGLVHRRIVQPGLAAWRTAGTAIALVGAAAMLACVVLAWPRPELLVAVGTLSFIALTVLALVLSLAPLHVPAILSLALAGLISFHLFQGHLHVGSEGTQEDLLTVLFYGQSGVVLLVLSAIGAAAAGVWRRAARRPDAVAYLWGTLGLGILSVLVATYAGFFSGIDGDLATVVFAVYAVALLMADQRLRNLATGVAGSVLVFVALAHGLGWNAHIIESLAARGWQPQRPMVVALLVHGTIFATLGFFVPRALRAPAAGTAEETARHDFLAVRSYSAMISSVLSLPIVFFAAHDSLLVRSGYGFWGAGIWGAVAFLTASAELFTAAHGLASVALVLAVTGVYERQAWWDGAIAGPRHLQAQMGTLAIWSVVWVGVRKLLQSVPQAAFLRDATWPDVDRVLLGAVVAGLPALAALGCAPGVAAELQVVVGGRSFDLASAILAVTLVALAIGICIPFGSGPGNRRDRVTIGAATLPFAFFLAVPLWHGFATAYWTAVTSAPAEACSPSAWVVLIIVAAALAVALLEEMSVAGIYGLVWLSLAIPLLVAGPFAATNATASALRWTIAVYGAVVGLTLANRRRLEALASRFGFAPALEGESAAIATRLRDFALMLTIAPLIALTLDAAIPYAFEMVLKGPSPGSFVARISEDWSIAGPLAILAAALCGFSLRERLPRLALAGSFVVQLGVAAFLVAVKAARGLPIDMPTVVEFVQWNGIALALFTLLWLKLQPQFDPAAIGPAANLSDRWSPLNIQVLLTAVTALVLPVWSIVVVVISPRALPPVTAAIGSPAGYVALGLALLAVAIRFKSIAMQWGMATIAVAGLATVGLGAASAAAGNTAENWVSYHMLMSGWTAVALLTTTGCLSPATFREGFAALTRRRPESPDDEAAIASAAAQTQEIAEWASRCTTVVGGLVLFLAVRGVATDPARPYWGVATVALLAGLATILGLWRRSQIYAYTSARLAALAATYAWTTPWLGLGFHPTPQSWVNLAEATAIAATLAGGFWLAIELWYQRQRGTAFDPTFAYPPVHRGTSRLALIVGCGLAATTLTARWFFFEPNPIPFAISNPGGWLLVVVLMGIFTGSLWDRRSVRAVPSLYALGLAAAGLAIDRIAPTGRDVPWFIGQALALHVALSAGVWALRQRCGDWALRWGIPDPPEIIARASRWMPTMTAAIEFPVVLTFPELWRRLLGAAACVVIAAGLPAFAQDERRSLCREAALLFLAIAAIDFGWGTMPVEAEPAFWLQRAVRLLEVLAITTFVYGVVYVRLLPGTSKWFAPARRMATVVGIGALASLGMVLALEGYWFDPVSGAPLTGVQIALVAAVLVGLTAALISLAILPGRDPFDLPESGRMYYVYTAEAVLALLFLHIYLTMPELFHGYLLPYWPLIVMGIAFFGVGVGEIFRRAKLPVLSEPLHRTGAFLPLLPALGFWIQSSRTSYSTLLFIVGLLYVILSMWRGAFLYSVAAALAGNAGLWALWHEHGIRLVDHPQLWLIPPALSVLVAVQLNRHRVNEEQVTGIRYLCTMIIYVSSTGDMFITGIGENLALPMILAGLSVLGALAGIALRVRAFLYLGSSFLLLSIVSMVWHAARHINHVWPWWAFGIGLGLAILALLGVFENKRKEVQALLENVRRWEP
jgi:hypothetical protein